MKDPILRDPFTAIMRTKIHSLMSDKIHILHLSFQCGKSKYLLPFLQLLKMDVGCERRWQCDNMCSFIIYSQFSDMFIEVTLETIVLCKVTDCVVS